jgi:hypothetical protein
MAHTGSCKTTTSTPIRPGRQAMNKLWADAMRVVYP